MGGPIVDLVLLRGLFADTALRPGVVLPAKVLEREGPRGWLLLNGVRVNAQLPPELAAGDVFRVRVQEVAADRLALQVLPQAGPSSPDAPASPTVGLPLPGGARFRVDPDPSGGAAPATPDGPRSIALRFDSPALGRLDFLLHVGAGEVGATIGIAPGAAEVVRGAAEELRSALAAATDRAASVQVVEREESLDVRA